MAKKHIRIINENTKEVEYDGLFENINSDSEMPADVAESLNLSRELYDIEVGYDGVYLAGYAPKMPIEEQQRRARAVRDEYFGLYVDWYQSKPLLWAEMSETEKTDIENYREYLKHYTDAPEWWLNNPKTFDEWKAANDAI